MSTQNANVSQYIKTTLKKEFNLTDGPQDKPVMGVDDILAAFVVHWASDTSVYPTEDDRLDVPTIMLFEAYTACRPAELVDGTKTRGDSDPLRDDIKKEDIETRNSGAEDSDAEDSETEDDIFDEAVAKEFDGYDTDDTECDSEYEVDKLQESRTFHRQNSHPESDSNMLHSNQNNCQSAALPEENVNLPHCNQQPRQLEKASEEEDCAEIFRKYKTLCYEDVVLWIVQDPGNAGRDVLAMEVMFRFHKGVDNKPKPLVLSTFILTLLVTN